MVKSIVTSLLVVLVFMILAFATDSYAETRIVEGGVIHFRGEIVEGASFSVETLQPLDTEGTIQSTSTLDVMEEGRKIGEIVTVTWN